MIKYEKTHEETKQNKENIDRYIDRLNGQYGRKKCSTGSFDDPAPV